MIQDFRYALRSLFRRKGFSAVVVLTLGLGIGSATAIYHAVDWFLFQRPSYPRNLFLLGFTGKDARFSPVIWQAHLKAFEALKDVFSGVGVATLQMGNIVADKDPVLYNYSEVSLNFFEVLGVSPLIGRTFVKGEDSEGRNQVAIVSHQFWKEHLGGKPDALGKVIVVDRQECAVVGILRDNERLPVYFNQGVFRPLVLQPKPALPWNPILFAFARTKPGVTREQAEAALLATKVDLPQNADWFTKDNRVALSTIGDFEKFLRPEMQWMLVGAVGFLFLIACLNATNLMLLHLVGRSLETSIRLALGGGRWHVVRLLLMEAVLLCAAGCLLGALVANGLIPLFAFASDSLHANWASWHLGPRTYGALAALAFVMSVAITIVPAISLLGSNIQLGLKQGGGAVGESPRMARIRSSFVVLQAAFAVILLVGAGLMVRTFHRLDEVRLGFDPSHRIRVRVGFPNQYAEKPADRIAVLDRIKEAFERMPGVTTVAYGSEALLSGYDSTTLDFIGADGAPMKVSGDYTSPRYQEAGGMALKGGRWFTSSDKVGVLINESLAKARFGGDNPIGQFLKPASSTGNFKGWEVIGVVADVRESMREPPKKKVYMPASWSPQMVSSFVVECTGSPDGKTAEKFRTEMYKLDPRLVCYSSSLLGGVRDEQLYYEHQALWVLQVLSVIAILLTVVGLFSIIAYTVDRRMAEFGIRMAMGASPAHLVSLVMRRGMILTALGIVAGIAGATLLTRFIQSLLFETAPFDVGVIAAVAALLLVSALAACIVPSLRASRPNLANLLKGN